MGLLIRVLVNTSPESFLSSAESNRNELVTKGALPVLVDVLRSRDPDVQYYCAAALSNMAVNERHRAMMVAVGYNDVIRELKNLLLSSREKVRVLENKFAINLIPEMSVIQKWQQSFT